MDVEGLKHAAGLHHGTVRWGVAGLDRAGRGGGPVAPEPAFAVSTTRGSIVVWITAVRFAPSDGA